MIKNILLLVLVAAVIAGCASDTTTGSYSRGGTDYGVTEGVFRGRWWSYYERGGSFLAGEYYAEAVQDFEKARQGRSSDTWRARTYGLHFVEFFPNRELGIAYYELERLGEAETYLNLSLEQVDTGRAHHYLDLVKRAQIARGDLRDMTAPDINIALEEVTLIATREVSIPIQVQDDVGVAAVEINGKTLHQRGSAEAIVFEEELLLVEGTHEIEIAATDLADKKVVVKKQVVVDLTGPTIGIFSPIEPTVTPEGTVILEGATVDKNGVISVGVGERILAESPGAPRLEFNTELPLTDGENTFILAALDKAGNETRTAIKVFRGDPNSFRAKLWLLEQKAPEMLMMASNTTLTMQMLDAMLSAVPEADSGIRLKSPVADQPYRHSRTLRVSGEVITQGKIISLTINGQPFTQLTGAPKEIFNRRIPIEDENTEVTISIEAIEEGGAVLKEEVEVELQPVPFNEPDTMLPVAIINFGGVGVTALTTETLLKEYEVGLLGLKRFNVLDRLEIESLLREQNLAASGVVDPAAAISVGKLVSAYVLVTGKVLSKGGNSIEIVTRIIDTETSRVTGILDEFVEDSTDGGAITKACDALSVQLADLYPRLWGTTLMAKGKIIIIDWTKEEGVSQGTQVLIFREEEDWVDEDTGEVLMEGVATRIGRAKITKVGTNAMAEMIELEEEGVPLEKGMLAITM